MKLMGHLSHCGWWFIAPATSTRKCHLLYRVIPGRRSAEVIRTSSIRNQTDGWRLKSPRKIRLVLLGKLLNLGDEKMRTVKLSFMQLEANQEPIDWEQFIKYQSGIWFKLEGGYIGLDLYSLRTIVKVVVKYVNEDNGGWHLLIIGMCMRRLALWGQLDPM